MTMYQICDIEIDFVDDYGTLPGHQQVEIINDIMSHKWEAEDGDDLLNQVSDVSGWSVESIEYIKCAS